MNTKEEMKKLKDESEEEILSAVEIIKEKERRNADIGGEVYHLYYLLYSMLDKGERDEMRKLGRMEVETDAKDRYQKMRDLLMGTILNKILKNY